MSTQQRGAAPRGACAQTTFNMNAALEVLLGRHGPGLPPDRQRLRHVRPCCAHAAQPQAGGDARMPMKVSRPQPPHKRVPLHPGDAVWGAAPACRVQQATAADACVRSRSQTSLTGWATSLSWLVGHGCPPAALQGCTQSADLQLCNGCRDACNPLRAAQPALPGTPLVGVELLRHTITQGASPPTETAGCCSVQTSAPLCIRPQLSPVPSTERSPQSSPAQVHMYYTSNDTSEITAQWTTTGRPSSPTVRYGTEPGLPGPAEPSQRLPAVTSCSICLRRPAWRRPLRRMDLQAARTPLNPTAPPTPVRQQRLSAAAGPRTAAVIPTCGLAADEREDMCGGTATHAGCAASPAARAAGDPAS